jgi:hypothetical protein
VARPRSTVLIFGARSNSWRMVASASRVIMAVIDCERLSAGGSPPSAISLFDGVNDIVGTCRTLVATFGIGGLHLLEQLFPSSDAHCGSMSGALVTRTRRCRPLLALAPASDGFALADLIRKVHALLVRGIDNTPSIGMTACRWRSASSKRCHPPIGRVPSRIWQADVEYQLVGAVRPARGG